MFLKSKVISLAACPTITWWPSYTPMCQIPFLMPCMALGLQWIFSNPPQHEGSLYHTLYLWTEEEAVSCFQHIQQMGWWFKSYSATSCPTAEYRAQTISRVIIIHSVCSWFLPMVFLECVPPFYHVHVHNQVMRKGVEGRCWVVGSEKKKCDLFREKLVLVVYRIRGSSSLKRFVGLTVRCREYT